MTATPVILAVDDEPEVLAAIARDLRARYAADYQVVAAASGQEAVAAVDELAQRGTPLALLVADQRMPGVTGIDVLRHAIEVFPTARKALLTAYADTDAAISAINDVGLDHYIMKPWQPPDQRLYPILDDLLDDWRAGHRPMFEGVRVVSSEWSRSGFEIRNFLATNQIPYRSAVLGRDEEADQLLESVDWQPTDLPYVFFPDGEPLARPTIQQVAERVGLHAQAKGTTYDVAIVGAGPAGLGAAVYAASEGLKAVLIESSAPGGQAVQSSLIENYLGFPKGLSGADLTRRAVSQARRFGAELVVPATVQSVERKDPFKVLHLTDGSTITAKALVVATGVSYRRLPAEGIDDLTGAGVYYGTSAFEAENHRGETLMVVGGGNSAGQAALYLARFTDDVTIVIRRDTLSETMSQYLIDNIAENPSVEVETRSQVVAVGGGDHLETVDLEHLDTGAVTTRKIGAMFVFIGQKPQTEWLGDLVDRDMRGFIRTGADLRELEGWSVARDPMFLESSVPGIFVAGDARHGSTNRVATAVGEGGTVIRLVHRYLMNL